MQKGEDHLDDAILEFRRILFLDPTNERARKNLERIRAKRGDKDRTVTMDAHALRDASSDVAAAEATPRKRRPRLRPRRKISRWVYATGIAGVGVLAAALLWTSRDLIGAYSSARGIQTPVSSSLSESPLILAGAHDEPATPADAKPTQADTPVVVQKDTVVAASVPDVKNTAPSEARQKPTRQPDVKQPETTVSKAVSREPVETGLLSVFFLGGVGEVKVNGKRFSQQPPFEGAVMPAGRYRVSCRMSGDSAPHEIAVTIAPGRETVIEYEMGGEPVVSGGDQE
jgi:hypothetical protein